MGRRSSCVQKQYLFYLYFIRKSTVQSSDQTSPEQVRQFFLEGEALVAKRQRQPACEDLSNGGFKKRPKSYQNTDRERSWVFSVNLCWKSNTEDAKQLLKQKSCWNKMVWTTDYWTGSIMGKKDVLKQPSLRVNNVWKKIWQIQLTKGFGDMVIF